MYFHNIATPQPPLKLAAKNKSKLSLTLPYGRTMTSQQQFGGQNGVSHEIEWS